MLAVARALPQAPTLVMIERLADISSRVAETVARQAGETD